MYLLLYCIFPSQAMTSHTYLFGTLLPILCACAIRIHQLVAKNCPNIFGPGISKLNTISIWNKFYRIFFQRPPPPQKSELFDNKKSHFSVFCLRSFRHIILLLVLFYSPRNWFYKNNLTYENLSFESEKSGRKYGQI